MTRKKSLSTALAKANQTASPALQEDMSARKSIVIRVDEQTHKNLKITAAQQGKTVQQLGSDALKKLI